MAILIVTTSHQSLGNTKRKTGVWLEELAAPYYVFIDQGQEVKIASIKGGEIPIDAASTEDEAQSDATTRFLKDQTAMQQLLHSPAIDTIDAEHFQAIFLPGGHGTMWDLPHCHALTHLIETYNQQHKIIAAICHGPAAFLSCHTPGGTPMIAKRRITSFTNSEEDAVQLTHTVPFLLETELRAVGGDFTNKEPFQAHVVQDDNILTGQNPASSTQLAQAMLQQLISQ
jgi:putative intracellular protease/amidase